MVFCQTSSTYDWPTLQKLSSIFSIQICKTLSHFMCLAAAGATGAAACNPFPQPAVTPRAASASTSLRGWWDRVPNSHWPSGCHLLTPTFSPRQVQLLWQQQNGALAPAGRQNQGIYWTSCIWASKRWWETLVQESLRRTNTFFHSVLPHRLVAAVQKAAIRHNCKMQLYTSGSQTARPRCGALQAGSLRAHTCVVQ